MVSDLLGKDKDLIETVTSQEMITKTASNKLAFCIDGESEP